MLRLVTGSEEPELNRLIQVRDPFACRIACLFESYGTGYDFCSFYIQYSDSGKPVSALSVYYSDINVYLTEKSDTGELSDFLTAKGFSSLLCSRPILKNRPSGTGIIMELKHIPSGVNAEGIHIPEPENLTRVWKLLKECEAEDFSVPSYEDYILDMSHKLRHGTALCITAEHNGELIGTASALFLSEYCGLIGAVAVRQDYRRRGVGAGCVSRIIKRLEGRNIYLMRSPDKHKNFYTRLGFDDIQLFYRY